MGYNYNNYPEDNVSVAQNLIIKKHGFIIHICFVLVFLFKNYRQNITIVMVRVHSVLDMCWPMGY